MQLKLYLSILWGHKWLILATLVTTVMVTTIGTFLTKPVFSASTTIRVATASSGTTSYTDYTTADRLMNTYTRIATSRPVLEEMTKKLGIQTIPQITAVAIPNTELLKISAEGPDPAVAQAAANTLALILISQSKELYSGSGKSQQEILGEQVAQALADLNQAQQDYQNLVAKSPNDAEHITTANQAVEVKQGIYATLLQQYEQARLREEIRANIISVVEPAIVPVSPSKPRKLVNISLGFLVGFAGGVGLAFLFENLNAGLYTSQQIEAVTRLPQIGRIPRIKSKGGFAWIKGGGNDNMPFKESFRQLRTKIFAQRQNDLNAGQLKSLLITSAEPGEGKSTVTAYLALALDQAGQRTLIIDCDMRQPNQHKIFRLPNDCGLSNLLDQKEADNTVQRSRFPNVDVITSGPLPTNPAELLNSPLMKALIEHFTRRYDLVLLDAPAFLVVADASVLVPLVDGVVLVARRNFIKEGAVREAHKQLNDLKARMIGVVVNNAEQNGTNYYYRKR